MPLKVIVLALLGVWLISAQAPNAVTRLEFDAAAIHLAIDDGSHDSDSGKGRFVTHNLTLKRLIAIAYDVDMRQISGGPGWVDSESYDIDARLPAEYARQASDKVPQMLQSLLADRFHLGIHTERREFAGYALTVSKQVRGMVQAKACEGGSDTHSNNTHLNARCITMDRFARYLSRNREVAGIVADKTGLSGAFDFELDWMPAALNTGNDFPADEPPSIFTALREQLGLRLNAAKVPALVIVIDRAEKAEPN